MSMLLPYYVSVVIASIGNYAHVRVQRGGLGGHPTPGSGVELLFLIAGLVYFIALIGLLVVGFVQLSWWHPILALIAGGACGGFGSKYWEFKVDDLTVALFTFIPLCLSGTWLAWVLSK